MASLTITMPAMASPLPNDHQSLVNTLTADGVDVLINYPPQVCDSDVDPSGAYAVISGERKLVVCQDNSNAGDLTIVNWTANDLDTIRHETFHIIQDCMKGTKNDSELDTVFTDLREVIDAFGVYETMEVIEFYLELYSDRRDISYAIINEIEAFYAARDISASEIPL